VRKEKPVNQDFQVFKDNKVKLVKLVLLVRQGLWALSESLVMQAERFQEPKASQDEMEIWDQKDYVVKLVNLVEKETPVRLVFLVSTDTKVFKEKKVKAVTMLLDSWVESVLPVHQDVVVDRDRLVIVEMTELQVFRVSTVHKDRKEDVDELVHLVDVVNLVFRVSMVKTAKTVLAVCRVRMVEMDLMAEKDRKVLQVLKVSQGQEVRMVFKDTPVFAVIEVKLSEPLVNKALQVWKAEKVKLVEKECKESEEDLVMTVNPVSGE